MKLIVATLASTFLATSAMAQSSDSSSTDSTAAGTATETTSASTQSGGDAAMAQDKVRQQLTDAGFQQVEILDASYLVRAQTEGGNTVLMVIDPPRAGMGTDSNSNSSVSGEQKKN